MKDHDFDSISVPPTVPQTTTGEIQIIHIDSKPHETKQISKGFFFAALAYLIWGAFPIYFALVGNTNPIEVVVYRVFTTFIFCVLATWVLGKTLEVLKILKSYKNLLWFAAAGVMIYANWEIYVIGVVSHRVLETSLGYFINPIVTVILAVVIFSEHLRPLQWLAVIIASVGVLISAILYAEIPWIALGLALSFGIYGTIKKAAAARSIGLISPLSALTLETLSVLPLAFLQGLLLFNTAGLNGHEQGSQVLMVLIFSGVVTAVPLMLFGAATSRLPLSYIGFIQFSTPTLQFLYGLLVLHEPMNFERIIGFIAVWIAVILLMIDMSKQIRNKKSTTL